MRLLLGPATVEALPSDQWEDQTVRDFLRIRDPGRKKSYEFRQGTWDGYHDFHFGGPCGDQILFPSGLLPWIKKLLTAKGIECSTESTTEFDSVQFDLPTELPEVREDLLSGVSLRDYQLLAVKKALLLRRGVVYAPPRTGKTLMQIALVKLFHDMGLPSVLLVNRTKLARQTARVARKYGVPLQIVQGSGTRLASDHVVATVQTLHRALRRSDPDLVDLLQRARLLQGDEIHFLSDSKQWITSALACYAPFRIGYSGTPFHREDGWSARDFWLRGCFGPLIYKITPEYLMERGFLVQADVFAVKVGSSKAMMGWNSWGPVYKQGIVENAAANRSIVTLAEECSKAGRTSLVLVAQIAHGEEILRLLKERGIDSVFAAGDDRVVRIEGGKSKTLVVSDEELLGMFQRGETGGIMVGSTVYDQGIDLPFVDTVILGGGWKSPILAIQRAYRCLTPSEGKGRGLIIDMAHHFNWILRAHSTARRRHLSRSVSLGKEVPVLSLVEAVRRIRG